MPSILLTQGKLAIVSVKDYKFLMKWHWYANIFNGHWYAGRNAPNGGTILMHREIAKLAGYGNAPRVDHKDGNGLNNLRANLRPATHQENLRNRGPTKKNTSGYKGVCYNKSPGRRKRWTAEIKVNNKKKNLGYYYSKEEAAKAYDAAAVVAFGDFAYLNFPQER